MHCRDKSSYNPYRDGKENFTSELQKAKHTVYQLLEAKKTSKNVFQDPDIFSTEFSSVNLCKLMKLEHSYHVVVGNDKRVKIWTHSQ